MDGSGIINTAQGRVPSGAVNGWECPQCHGTDTVQSEITHGQGWTIAVDRRTEKCPACGGKRRKLKGKSR